jgi:hypothetical protein
VLLVDGLLSAPPDHRAHPGGGTGTPLDPSLRRSAAAAHPRVLRPCPETPPEAGDRGEERRSGRPAKGIHKGFKNPWKYVVDGKVQRDEPWTAMRKYAGPRSWIKLSGDSPQLQPEILLSMRRLLRKSRKMFSALHTSAIA